MPFAPSDISGLKIWLRGDAGLGLSDGDPVATWSDQSGGGHNFTESTNKPTYKAAIRNGLGVVRFTDGSSQILNGGNLSSLFTSGASVFVAANGTNAFNDQMIYEHQSIDSWWQFGAQGYFGPFRSSRLSNVGTFSNGWHAWSITADNGSNYKVWLDGVSKINDTAGFTFQGGNSHVIGRQRTNGSTGGQDIGEICVFDSALNDTDRGNMETYLQRYTVVSSPGTATPSAVVNVGWVPNAAAYQASPYVSAVMADNPISYWRLGETSGTDAVDAAFARVNGVYTNGPTLNQTGLLIGDSDKAVSFDGSNDSVVMSGAAALQVTTAFTLEAWIKVASGEVIFGPVLVNLYDGSSVRFQLGSWDGSVHTLKPSVGFYNGSWHVAKASSNISVNAVHHIVGTWDGTTLKIYVDGTQAGTDTPGSSINNANTSGYSIGARWDSSGDNAHFKGVIDEVAVYGTDIGSTRIAAHYAVGTTNPNGTATPAAVAGVSSAAANATGVGNTSPSTVAGTGAAPAVTAHGAATGLPSATAGVGAVPAPTGAGSAAASPAAVAGVGAVPAPTVVGAGSGQANPLTVAGVGAVPAPTLTTSGGASPSATAGVGAVPAPTMTGLAFAMPVQVAGTGVVPGPTVGAVRNATVIPLNVAGVGRVPRPIAAGQGTGGGGGTANGATDFWSIAVGS